jgi:uncharacterized membrane protein YhiD involved in acid resistance
MAALAGGLAALVLGIIGIIAWWGYFVKALMAGIPIMLILGGALAAYLGFEEIKDKRTEETFSDTSTDQKDEVIKNLKEEIKELKGEKESEDQEIKDEEKEPDSTE